MGARRSRRAPPLRSQRGAMPPLFVEKNIGIQKFKHDPSLSDEEIAKIAKWADSGAPRGNPADMPRAAEIRRHRQVDDRRAGSGPEIEGRDRFRRPDPTGGATSGSCRPVSPKIATSRPSKCARSTTSRRGGADQDRRRTLRVSPHDVLERGARASAASSGRRSDHDSWPIHEVGRNADIFPPEAGPAAAGEFGAGADRRPHPLERPRDQRRISSSRSSSFPKGYKPTLPAARRCGWATASTST